MKISIDVKREHIDGATPRHSCLCPIARALTQAGYTGVGVNTTEVVTNQFHAVLPEAARKFVDDFDYFMPVEPFTFELLTEGRI